MAEALLFNTPPVDVRADHPNAALFEGVPEDWQQQSRDQKIAASYIIEGTKDGLIADLEIKRNAGSAPLDIINDPLMAGMSEVKRLFNNNELIVAEVLQSAEAMTDAVTYLEQFMEKSESSAHGKIVLATVKATFTTSAKSGRNHPEQ